MADDDKPVLDDATLSMILRQVYRRMEKAASPDGVEAELAKLLQWMNDHPSQDATVAPPRKTLRTRLSAILPPDQVDAVLGVVLPVLFEDIAVVALDAPCVECGERFEPGDRVTWRLRWLPQGLVHAECR